MKVEDLQPGDLFVRVDWENPSGQILYKWPKEVRKENGTFFPEIMAVAPDGFSTMTGTGFIRRGTEVFKIRKTNDR